MCQLPEIDDSILSVVCLTRWLEFWKHGQSAI